MPDPPVVCKLSPPELQRRRAELLDTLRGRTRETRALPNGYALRFDPADATLELLFQVLRLERDCCPFLRFQLTLEPAAGPFWLELTGPPGTKEMLAGELGLIGPPGAPQ
jgi:hypothetical protein